MTAVQSIGQIRQPGKFEEKLMWGAPLVCFGALTAMRIVALVQSWSPVIALNAVGLALLTSMFALRTPPKDVDRSWRSLIIALIGNFLPFAFVFSHRSHATDPLPLVISVVTVLLAIWTVAALNRSLGVTPANRGVKTTGPYRFVRHPLYVLVIISQFGVLLEYPSVFNACILLAATVFKSVMIVNEERVLRRDPEYLAYMERVRYRAIPGII